MLKLIFAFFTITFSFLHANIEHYFKKIEDKSGFHTMRGIDFIYMINLDARPEKWELSINELLPYGIYPCRLSAVNGWQLPLSAFKELGVTFYKGMKNDIKGTKYLEEDNGRPRHERISKEGETYFCHCMSPGAIGIVLSHLSILQDAYDSGYETIWVMEDDIQVIENPHLLSDYIEKLDKLVGKAGWDVLFTDPDTKDKQGNYVACRSYARRPNFTPQDPTKSSFVRNLRGDFREIGARYGAYSMIIRRSGIKKILHFIKTYNIFLPHDMDMFLIPDMHFFSLNKDIISTIPDALSDNGSKP